MSIDNLAEQAGAEPRCSQTSSRCEGVSPDHFIVRHGVRFAGLHLLIDLWDGQGLDDLSKMDRALRDVVATCDATLLHLHLHHFTPNNGISGVAVLAESHVSVHTWPERGYGAFDVFMCGSTKPELAVAVLERHFLPERLTVKTLRRGDATSVHCETA